MGNAQVDGKSMVKNMSWKFAERITAQIVTFAVSIVLARVLSPSDYGAVAIVTVFITIANVFVSDGLGSSLIQKKDADELDFYSALWFNLGFSIVIYLLLFLIAPYLASYFGSGYEVLCPVLRVLGLRIIVASINSIQQAYVARRMIFKKFFWATLFGTVASAVVGIFMAYSGYGVWALVGQYLTNTTVDTIFLAFSLGIVPKFRFSIHRVKFLFDYGIKILGSGLLVAVYTEIRSFIIGKVYSSSDLAYYDKARQFPSLFVNNIVATISAVLFPKMSSEQDDIEKMRNTTRLSIRFASFLMCPLMFGLIGISRQLILILLTDKWVACVPYLQIMCIAYLWQPIHSANIQAIKALGRSDIVLKLEIIKKTIELVVLLAVMFLGVDAIVISMAANSTIFVFVNAIPNKKLLNYSLIDQIKDITMPLTMSIIMCFVVLLVGKIINNIYAALLIQISVGIVVYFGMSVCLKSPEVMEIKKLIMKQRNT